MNTQCINMKELKEASAYELIDLYEDNKIDEKEFAFHFIENFDESLCPDLKFAIDASDKAIIYTTDCEDIELKVFFCENVKSDKDLKVKKVTLNSKNIDVDVSSINQLVENDLMRGLFYSDTYSFNELDTYLDENANALLLEFFKDNFNLKPKFYDIGLDGKLGDWFSQLACSTIYGIDYQDIPVFVAFYDDKNTLINELFKIYKSSLLYKIEDYISSDDLKLNDILTEKEAAMDTNTLNYKIFKKNDLDELVEIKDISNINLPNLADFAFQDAEKTLYFKQDYGDAYYYTQEYNNNQELAISDGKHFINFDNKGNFISLDVCELSSVNTYGSIVIDTYKHEHEMESYKNGYLEFVSNGELYYLQIDLEDLIQCDINSLKKEVEQGQYSFISSICDSNLKRIAQDLRSYVIKALKEKFCFLSDSMLDVLDLDLALSCALENMILNYGIDQLTEDFLAKGFDISKQFNLSNLEYEKDLKNNPLEYEDILLQLRKAFLNELNDNEVFKELSIDQTNEIKAKLRI